MRQSALFAVILLSAVSSVCSAGTIAKGVWSPSGCGAEPPAPQVNQTTVENFNKSIKPINDWQDKMNAFNTCLVKEANDDLASVNKSVTERQAKLKALLDKVQADTTAASAKLEQPASK
jgi:uncharacterized coiled-coil protein SlyX